MSVESAFCRFCTHIFLAVSDSVESQMEDFSFWYSPLARNVSHKRLCKEFKTQFPAFESPTPKAFRKIVSAKTLFCPPETHFSAFLIFQSECRSSISWSRHSIFHDFNFSACSMWVAPRRNRKSRLTEFHKDSFSLKFSWVPGLSWVSFPSILLKA